MASTTLAYDVDGSARGASHDIPVGARVEVTIAGVPQWRDQVVRVFRHDRNGTYRLAFSDGTYVTRYAAEVVMIAE